MTFNYFAPAIARLLIPITAMLAAGIWWQATPDHKALPIIVMVIIMIVATVAATLTKKKRILRLITPPLIICAFFCGALLLSNQKSEHKKTQKSLCGKNLTVRGTVTALEKSKQKFFRQAITIKISSLQKKKDRWRETTGNIRIYVRNHDLHISDHIELKNITLKNPAGSPFDNYLMKSGIATTACVAKLNYRLLHRPPWSTKKFIFQQRKNVQERLAKKITAQTFALLSSIFLGNRSEKKYLLERSKEQFGTWGILHFLARSGLHLVLFILLWEFILGFLPIAFIYKQMFLACLGGIYCLLSWPSIPFIRALSIFLLYKMSPLFNARTHLPHLLAIVIFCILVSNPSQLFFLDFQLSFGLTFALAWFGRIKQKNNLLLRNS